jgi:hypothetical protein
VDRISAASKLTAKRPGLRFGALLALSTLALFLANCAASSDNRSSRLIGAYIAVDGDDANPCSRDAPCASLNRAYAIARPGETVEVATGTYPPQELSYDSSKTSRDDVVFQPAPGAQVVLAELTTGDPSTGLGAKHFEIRSMRVTGWVSVRRGGEDVTLRNLDMTTFAFSSAQDVRIIGGDIGPAEDAINHINACGDPGCLPTAGVTIDGAYFHDIGVSNEDKHSECLMVWPGKRIVIRNSRFERCKDFDILFKNYGPAGYISDVLLENNFFDVPIARQDMPYSVPVTGDRSGYSVKLSTGGSRLEKIIVRNNSFLGGLLIDDVGGVVVNARIVANVGPKDQFSCWQYVEFSYNVWTKAACGATDISAQSGFRDPAAVDLRLRRDAAAIDHGDPKNFPAADIEGEQRPKGSAPDAGADEAG